MALTKVPEIMQEFNQRVISASTTLLPSDTVIQADTSGGNLTLTLPDATTVQDKIYIINKSDTFTGDQIKIETTASQALGSGDIWSGKFYLQSQDNYVQLISDGTQWQILDQFVDYESSINSPGFNVWPLASATWGDLNARLLLPGVYETYVAVHAQNVAAIAADTVFIGVHNVAGNVGPGSIGTFSARMYNPGTNAWSDQVEVNGSRIVVTAEAGELWYLKGFAVNTVNFNQAHYIRFRRVY